MKLYAVIMAGGSGTRFWPLSRRLKPKQLLKLAGEETLLAQTVNRVLPLVPADSIYIVTGKDILEPTVAAVPQIPRGNILAEPMQRNTAPCVGLAARLIAHRDADAVLAVLPADHLIKNEKKFRRLLGIAAHVAAKKDAIVTFGIEARTPETGYGYIEFAEEAATRGGVNIHRVARFHEKPVLKTARKFVKAGNFAWNSGMFVFGARTILGEIDRFMPELGAALREVNPALSPKKLQSQIDRLYPSLPSISIDYGVMEKSDRMLALRADIGWSDVGSFAALPDIFGVDENGNCVRGDGFVIDGSGNIIHAGEDGVVVALGVSDLVIVRSGDAILVCRKDAAQDIRKVVDTLKSRVREKFI